MLRKILIVDDSEINRILLHRMLQDEYQVTEAFDGKEAMNTIRSMGTELSAILLDIVMPELDGFEVLATLQKDETLSQIPVIVTTGSDETDSEVKALDVGANDYVTKPYNPNIIKRRLRNIIELREKAAIVNATKVDALTGLMSRSAFFETVAEMVKQKEPGFYVMSCFDVEKFKVINDLYGNAKGDEVLKRLARIFREGFDYCGGICCRIMADNFALLYPVSFMNSSEIAEIRSKAEGLDGSISPITFSIGRYLVEDISVLPSAMYDRASMAKQKVKGRFDRHIATYNESMRSSMLKEQAITSQMREALTADQFEVWFQPQYNHSTKALIGAEALVRWRHPTSGMISPGEFIPIFERNGFVYELDKYVWRKTCQYLRKWIDANETPVPVSVNISRYDILRDDLTENILRFVNEYQIPIGLLRLEITESAFANGRERIISVVRLLRQYGFTVEIDDFGSGYSSLNTLKDVPADVIKLDMCFLEGEDESGKGGSILESVVRMTKWLGMSVIAEGVELETQADYLLSIGCSTIQGYLYAKPMPETEYEELLLTALIADEEKSPVLSEQLNQNEFWNPQSIDNLIFNSFIGAACIFEYSKEKIELLRANKKYEETITEIGMSIEEALRLDWIAHMNADDRCKVINAILESSRTGKEVVVEFSFLDIPGAESEIYMRCSLRVISRTVDRYLIYCTNEDVTSQKLMYRKEHEKLEQLQLLNSAASQIMAQSDANVGINSLLKMTLDYFGADRSFIFEYNYADNICHYSYEVCAQDVAPVIDLYRELPLQNSWYWLKTFEKERVIHIENVSALPAERNTEAKIFNEIDAHSVLAIALKRGPRVIGTMGIINPKERLKGFENLSALGDYICVMLMHKMSDERLKQSGAIPLSDQDALMDAPVSADFSKDAIEAYKSLQLLTENIPGGIAVLEIEKDSIRILQFNDGFYSYSGYSRNEFNARIKGDVMANICSDDVAAMEHTLRQLETNPDQTVECTYKVICKNNMPRWMNLRARVSERLADSLIVNVVQFDVTELFLLEERKKRQEQETRIRYENEMQLRHELIKDSLVYYQLNLTIKEVEEFLTKCEDESKLTLSRRITPELRKEVLSRVYPGDRDIVAKDIFTASLIDRYLEGITLITREYRRMVNGRGYCWVKAKVNIMQRPDTEDIIAFIYVKDIDVEKKAHLALNTIVDTEIESVVILNVNSKTAYPVHMRSARSSLKLYEVFSFDHIFAELNRVFLSDEDLERGNNFFRVENLTESLKQSKMINLTYNVKDKDGLKRKITSAYYLDEVKESIVLVRRDITALYEEEQKQKHVLECMASDAKEASLAKSKFLSGMSHDMRTPLNAVLSFSDRELSLDKNEEELREDLDKIHSSGSYLLAMINDVLDMSRIEQNKLVLNPVIYHFAEFVNTMKNVIGELSRHKNIRFLIDASNAQLHVLKVDKVRMNQIFINLLSNSVKFTPNGGTIELIVENLDDVNDKVIMRRFLVRDNGIGMSEEFLPHAFESFQQEMRQEQAEYSQGTGLGLSIVKELVETMGGKITVKSIIHHGTTFFIDLPFEILPEEEKDYPVFVEKTSLGQNRILIAEDNEINAQITSALLQKWDLFTETACNGKVALEMFQNSEENYYGLILMDLRMPVMGGVDSAKAIRALPRKDAGSVPIIALTADVFDEDKVTIIEAGMNDLLPKPIEPDVIYRKLSELLSSNE